MFIVTDYPQFTWSLSRHKTLMDCARKYYYDYYAGHNGWLYESSTFAKTAYRLKKLTSLEMFFGHAVHSMIDQVMKSYLNMNTIPTEEELYQRLRTLLNTAYIDSTKRKSLWMDKPKHYTMFHELYYGDELPADKVQAIQERLSVSVKHFLASQTFTDITSKKEMRFIESERFRTMTLNGTKLFIVMDFVYRDLEKGKWIIVDWKTGKKSAEDKNQLALYALYLQREFNVPSLDDIEIRNEYLLTGESKSHQLKDIDLDKVQELFGISVEQMAAYLDDEEKNRPLDLPFFEKNEHPQKCSRCNFQELCEMY